jgi:hypothetical protein
LARAIEQLATAVGEEIVLAALEQGNVRAPVAALACKQCSGSGNWRCIADRDVTYITDQPRNDVGKKFFA